MNNNLTLGALRKTRLSELYDKLLSKQVLTDQQIESLYRLALIFLSQNSSYVKEFGYRILIKNCLYSSNFRPLLSISMGLGYYPLTKLIDTVSDGSSENGFLYEWSVSFLEEYRKDSMYMTQQQRELFDMYDDSKSDTLAVIAPTSYGKSGLIMNTINTNTDCNVCVLVPTKALISQTKMRILKSLERPGRRKIITHPDMYQATDNNFVALLTQERLLRLLEKYDTLKFGVAIIDEAHNLFNDDTRNRLLAATIGILHSRAKSTVFKFLSPFLTNSENLKVATSSYDIKEKKISEHVKVNNYFHIDFTKDRILNHYDQFLNKSTIVDGKPHKSVFDFIQEKAAQKNIIYVNRPPKLEKVARELAAHSAKVDSRSIDKACRELAKYLHADYDLIECLQHGVVYHHGSVPDVVKLYIESIYTAEPKLKYMVCSSTLLEGVNIPAESLFVLEYKKGLRKLSPSQFKNLVGRLARFSELFSPNNRNLELLEPNVYVIKSGFMDQGANIKKFLQDSVKADKREADKLENVLLQNTKDNAKKKAGLKEEEEFLANFEPGIIGSNLIRIAVTEIGIKCFKNHVKEIEILAHEASMQQKVDQLIKGAEKAASSLELFEMIATVFIEFIDEKRDHDNILRLRHSESRNFYAMFLDWQMRSAPFSELIGRLIAYWDRRLLNGLDSVVYVGKWGDITRQGRRPLWVDLKEKTPKQRLNLAIVRIKEEQDFVENSLIKFVEILNDFQLVDGELYKAIKYGTDDEERILLIKNGYSNGLAKLVLDKYKAFLTIDTANNTVSAQSEIVSEMRKNDENDILIFEATLNVK
jgi:hypothetical protein